MADICECGHARTIHEWQSARVGADPTRCLSCYCAIFSPRQNDMTYETKDSGQREEFSTGSRRDTRAGKGRFDLIPILALRRLAGLYQRGAEKYGDFNWQKGQPLMRYYDSLLRHMFAAVEGQEDEDHEAAVIWNAIAFLWTRQMIRLGALPKELDDRPVIVARHAQTQLVASSQKASGT